MRNKADNRSDHILTGLDGLHKAAAPDFFYTRLIARMQKESLSEKRAFFIFSPAFITVSLFILFVLNIVSISRFDKRPELNDTLHIEKPATIETFAEAYELMSASVYE